MQNYSDDKNRDAKKDFGKMLKAARERKGMKQEELAEKIGYDNPQTISNWETGKSTPKSFDTAMKLSYALECDLDYLTGRIKETTHDIHYVHDFTGLSEEAIKKIVKEKDRTVSQFIENPIFSDFIRCFGDYCGLLDSIQTYEQYEKAEDDIDITLDNGKNVKLPYSLAFSLFEQRLMNNIIVLCQRALGERISELLRSEQGGG